MCNQVTVKCRYKIYCYILTAPIARGDNSCLLVREWLEEMLLGWTTIFWTEMRSSSETIQTTDLEKNVNSTHYIRIDKVKKKLAQGTNTFVEFSE